MLPPVLSQLPWFVSYAIVALVLNLPAPAQLTQWAGADASTAAGQSSFVSIQTTQDQQEPKIFMAGNATSSFDMGCLPALSLPSVQSGIVVGGVRNGLVTTAVSPLWQTTATSTQQVTFTDLILLPNSNSIAVCGSFDTQIDFKLNPVDSKGNPLPITTAFTLSQGRGVHGFFALLDQTSGQWTAAFVTNALRPASITCDAADSVLLTGEGALAARYSTSTGAPIWVTAAASKTTRAAHIASAPSAPLVVLTEENLTISEPGVVLSNLDPLTGQILWTRRMGGPGIDKAGGLAIDPWNRIHLAFIGDYDETTYDGSLVAVADPNVGESVFTASVFPNGTTTYVAAAARPYNYDRTNKDLLVCNDLAVCPTGSVMLACHGDGDWAIGDIKNLYLNAEAILIHVDAAGRTLQFLRASKEKTTSATATAVCIDGENQATCVGDYSGKKTSDFAPATTLPSRTTPGAFVATVKVINQQNLYAIYDNPDDPTNVKLKDLCVLIKDVGAIPYAEADAESLGKDYSVLSFYGTPAMVASLQMNSDIVVTQESKMTRNGLNISADWGLKRIAESYSDGTSFPYVDTENPVRLYLIDTAVKNPVNWINPNPKLTLKKSVLIRGSGDPVDSSAFKHGTQMLSLIGGSETGAAPGVPINVVNYDIYPNGGTTSITLLTKAILEAVKDYRASGKKEPATICIATSSTTAATSYSLQSSIELAVSEGMTVLVSAGNLGNDASAYIPAAYGVMDGVICTGASDQNDLVISSSNYGPSVDILAPGQDILTLSFDQTIAFELITGTSPATALSTAAVLATLSAKGASSPAEIETNLKAAAFLKNSLMLRLIDGPVNKPGSGLTNPEPIPDGAITDPASPISLSCSQAIFSSGSGSLSPDTDTDGTSDLLESFQGTNPAVQDSSSARPTASLSPTNEIVFSFPIDGTQLDGTNLFLLRNGLYWRIRCTTNLTTWEVPNGSLAKTTDAKGQVWLTATFPASQPSCFARLEVVESLTR